MKNKFIIISLIACFSSLTSVYADDSDTIQVIFDQEISNENINNYNVDDAGNFEIKIAETTSDDIPTFTLVESNFIEKDKNLLINSEGENINNLYAYNYQLTDNLYAIVKEGIPEQAIYNSDTKLTSDFIYKSITTSSDHNFVSFISSDSKAGLLDKDGNILIEPTLETITEKDNTFLCFDGEKLAIYSKANKSLGDFKYDLFSGFYTVDKRNLAIVEIDLKYGIIDENEDIVLPIIYDYIEDFTFNYGHTIAYRNQSHIVIDKNGNIVIDDMYDDVILSSKYIWTAKKDGKYGYINTKGKIIIDIDFDEALAFTSYKNAIVKSNGKYGVIDQVGNYLIDPLYKEISSTDNNLFIVRDYDTDKYGIIDIDSNIILDLKYDFIGKFSHDELASITINDTYALINSKGKIISNFEKIEDKKPPKVINYDTIESFMSVDSFLYGLRDINRVVILEPMYDWISKTNDGLFIVTKDSKTGIINYSGEVIIPIMYDSISDFHNGNALAKIEGKYRLISKENKIVSDFSCYDYYSNSFENEYNNFAFLNDDGYGIADFNGNILIEASKQKINTLSDDLIAYENDGLWGVMDHNKNIIIDARFDSIYRKYDSYIVTRNDFHQILDLKGNELSKLYDGFQIMTYKLYRFTTSNDGLYGLYNVETQREVLSEMYPTMYTLENKYDYKKSTVEIAFDTDDPQRISNIGLLNTDGSLAITPGDYEFYFKTADIINYYDYDYNIGLYSMENRKKLDTIYQEVGSFDDTYVTFIKHDSKYALINRNLDIITPFIFDHIGKFKDGYADISIGSKKGRINAQGEYTLQ